MLTVGTLFVSIFTHIIPCTINIFTIIFFLAEIHRLGGFKYNYWLIVACYMLYECQECKEIFRINDNFCPNCGGELKQI